MMKCYSAFVSALVAAGLLCGGGVRAADQDKAAGASPDSLRQQAAQLFRDGDRIEALGLLERARTAYEKAITEDPDNYQVTRKLAMTLFDMGEYEAAQEVFKRALALRNEAPEQEVPEEEAPEEEISTMVAVNPAIDESSTNAEPVPEVIPVPAAIRGFEIHPDILVDPDPHITDDNIRSFVVRAVEANVNVVYAHGMSEPEADGSYSSAYFDTLLAPVSAAVLQPMAEQLHSNNISLHVIMPVLSLALPETDSNRSIMVMSRGNDRIQPSQSWRKRISPFSTNGLSVMTHLYEDLATHVPLDGIVLGDDAYLTDKEDLNPAAVEKYKAALVLEEFSLDKLSPEQKSILTDLKVARLDRWCKNLEASVKAIRPEAIFSRTLYAPIIHHPPSREWLAQDFEKALEHYDRVYLLADPEMEELGSGTRWIIELVEKAALHTSGAGKTVFSIPTYSQRRKRWHSERYLAKLVSRMRKAGTIHIVLAPDNVMVDRPRIRKVKRVFQAAP